MNSDPKRRKKGGGKGKASTETQPSKGKPKGKPDSWMMNVIRKWKMEKHFATPVCSRFNKAGCDAAECKYTHACGYCGATDHGAEQCAAFMKFFRASGGKK